MENNQSKPKLMPWIIFILAITMSIVFVLSGEGGGSNLSHAEPSTAPTEMQEQEVSESLFHLERVGYDANFEFYRDPVTDVLYLRLTGYNETGLITMQDPRTGLPLTYAHYMKLYNQLSENYQ